MRRQTPLPHLLYNYLFPNPTSNDPPSFSAHLARNLVPEVRIEVATFYGNLDSLEARYPGLNYCHPPHRMRLGRFVHHRRLFEAFDNLNLTYKEIQDFCCWEGTRWARDRYEKDEGTKIYDTTGNEIKQWIDRRERREQEHQSRRQDIKRQSDISVIVEEAHPPPQAQRNHEDTSMSDEEEETELATSESSEAEPASEAAARQQHIAEVRERAQQSIVNQRIISAWEQGQGLQLTPELEQLIKEQTEQGRVPDDGGIRRISESMTNGTVSSRRAAA